MSLLFQLSKAHMAALGRGADPPCAECRGPDGAVPPAAATGRPLAPGPLQLTLVEFRDEQAVRLVGEGARTPVGPAHWQPITAPGRVAYLYRHHRGATRLVAELPNPSQYVLTPRPEDAGAEYYLFLSHVALPAARLREQYEANQAGIAALRQRAVRLDPDDPQTARRTGARSATVVLTDYRRIARELYLQLRAALDAHHAWAAEPARARRLLLADLAFQTAIAAGEQSPRVWRWLAQGPVPAGAAFTNWDERRPAALRTGVGTKRYVRYTRLEDELYEARQESARQMLPAERAAGALYAWMRRPGYEQMRWDTFRAGPAQREMVRDEAALIAAAAETEAGRAYVDEYVMRGGSWHARFVLRPTDEEVAACRAGGVDADAHAALIQAMAVAGVTMAGTALGRSRLAEVSAEWTTVLAEEAGRDAGKGPDDFDRRKNTVGLADGGTKFRLDADVERTAAARRTAEGGRPLARERASDLRTEAAATTAEALRLQAAAEAETVTARWAAVHLLLLKPLARRVDLPPLDALRARFDVVTRRMVDVGEALASVRRAAKVAADAREATAAAAGKRAAAAQAERALGEVALVAERYTRQLFLHTDRLRQATTTVAWMTTGMNVLFGAVNLSLAYGIVLEAPAKGENWAKLGGAVGDAMYAFEFVLKRPYDLLKSQEVAALGEGAKFAATGNPALRAAAGRLAPFQVAGVIGGIISTYVAFTSGKEAAGRGDVAIAVGQGFAFGGSLLLTVASAASLLSTASTLGVSVAGVASGHMLEAVAFAANGAIPVIGAGLALVGAAILYNVTPTPFEAWLERSPWGPKAARGTPDLRQQLAGLLAVLFSPTLEAATHSALPAPWPTPAAGRYGLSISFRLATVVPEATTYDFDLRLEQGTERDLGVQRQASVGSVGMRSSDELMRLGIDDRQWDSVPGFGPLRLKVSPIPREKLSAARRGQVQLPVRMTGRSPALVGGGFVNPAGDLVAATIEAAGEAPTLTVLLPIRVRLPNTAYGPVGVLPLAYRVSGVMRARVWDDVPVGALPEQIGSWADPPCVELTAARVTWAG